MDQNNARKRVKEEFKEKLGIGLGDKQFAFVDNTVLYIDPQEVDKEESNAIKNELQNIKEFIVNNQPFLCKDITLVENESQ